MTFLTRSIGQTVDIPLAELPQLAQDDATRAQLEEAGAVARVAMVTGATRDAWVATMTAVNRAAQEEKKNPKKLSPSEKQAIEEAQGQRLADWSRTVLEQCLVGLVGWAPGVDEVTDPVRLTAELQRIPIILFAVASRALEEQLPTRRQEKS